MNQCLVKFGTKYINLFYYIEKNIFLTHCQTRAPSQKSYSVVLFSGQIKILNEIRCTILLIGSVFKPNAKLD